MDENPQSWIEYLNNDVALKNIVDGNVPQLASLLLAQLVIDQAGAVYVSLNFRSLPLSSPSRWSTRGCNCVQLRLSFVDIVQLSIAGVYEGNLDVDASFRPDRHFSMPNPEFKVELVYGSVTTGLYPFDSRIFEEPRDWYHT
jgi:hypothetical protein